MKRTSPKISITIPPEILLRIEEIAELDGRSKSNAIAQLLRKGIEIHDQAQNVLREAAGPAYTVKKKGK